MGVYGPHTQVKLLFKALIFLTCEQNIIIYSQMRFQLYQSHRLTAIGLQSGKKVHKLGLCGQFRHFKMTLKLKLQT